MHRGFGVSVREMWKLERLRDQGIGAEGGVARRIRAIPLQLRSFIYNGARFTLAIRCARLNANAPVSIVVYGRNTGRGAGFVLAPPCLVRLGKRDPPSESVEGQHELREDVSPNKCDKILVSEAHRWNLCEVNGAERRRGEPGNRGVQLTNIQPRWRMAPDGAGGWNL